VRKLERPTAHAQATTDHDCISTAVGGQQMGGYGGVMESEPRGGCGGRHKPTKEKKLSEKFD